MPKKIRVYELAKELGLTNKEGLELALSLGIGVKSHSSSIEDAQADRVRRKADAEGLRRPVQPEEPAPAKKAAEGHQGREVGRSRSGHGTTAAPARHRPPTAHRRLEQLRSSGAPGPPGGGSGAAAARRPASTPRHAAEPSGPLARA